MSKRSCLNAVSTTTKGRLSNNDTQLDVPKYAFAFTVYPSKNPHKCRKDDLLEQIGIIELQTKGFVAELSLELKPASDILHYHGLLYVPRKFSYRRVAKSLKGYRTMFREIKSVPDEKRWLSYISKVDQHVAHLDIMEMISYCRSKCLIT